VSMFYLMPNMVITMPYDAKEASNLLFYGFMKQKSPFVIRYPRGTVLFNKDEELISFEEISPTWTYLKKGTKINMISYGPSLDLLIQAASDLSLDASIINARFIKPIDIDMLHEICQTNQPIFVYEECSNAGSLYPQILKFMAKHEYKNRILEMSITDQVVEHGHYKDILKHLKMDLDSVKISLKEFLK
ncbi:MAG: transketolase C-terminal domain-containing protein, partial [Acholeplasmataceae bacterium]|nr:transketolase C-terminal domain-containing protein [Acholeplasmataceae bacterium]